MRRSFSRVRSDPVDGEHVFVQAALLDEPALADRAGELLLLAALVLYVAIQRALVLVAAVAVPAGEGFLEHARAEPDVPMTEMI